MSEAGSVVRYALSALAAGHAEPLDGRGTNSCYRVTHLGRPLSVKVHCADRSSPLELRRLRRVDAALYGRDWYPPLLDVGFSTEHQPRLVVVRPFVRGAPSTDARQHIGQLLQVMSDLKACGTAVEAVDGLVGDYASPWLSSDQREARDIRPFLTGRRRVLARALENHLDELLLAVSRLGHSASPIIYHGDLHGRNLISHGQQPLTVIDWDEAGFTHRPADAAKALWLTCRQGRGDFVLHPETVRTFLRTAHASLGIPYANVLDLAALGALWFLPRRSHLALLDLRGPDLVPWYLDWISRFWSRYRENRESLTAIADALRAEGTPARPAR
ncbi:aminoglycoside phosphotransferase family protein [Streptomyces sp. NPDC005438]|uniref:aminoglycoside phosphotransferase family protein n=1 Tax=Streptomyces sp. NPDC005438 TaxID=3156880 RepID=UPI0033A004E4